MLPRASTYMAAPAGRSERIALHASQSCGPQLTVRSPATARWRSVGARLPAQPCRGAIAVRHSVVLHRVPAPTLPWLRPYAAKERVRLSGQVTIPSGPGGGLRAVKWMRCTWCSLPWRYRPAGPHCRHRRGQGLGPCGRCQPRSSQARAATPGAAAGCCQPAGCSAALERRSDAA